MFKIIFIKLGFWVVKLTDNKNNDDDDNDHSLYLLRT